jgi:hypothetical protein
LRADAAPDGGIRAFLQIVERPGERCGRITLQQHAFDEEAG